VSPESVQLKRQTVRKPGKKGPRLNEQLRWIFDNTQIGTGFFKIEGREC
jgi:hypothetical protein